MRDLKGRLRLSDRAWLARRRTRAAMHRANPMPGPLRDLIAALRPPREIQEVRKQQAGGGTLQHEDLPYLRELSEAVLSQSTPKASAALHLMTALSIIAVIWAYFARVDEVTRIDARVIPASREQIVTSTEGGALAELLVEEGATVDKGQPLLRIDPTRARSQYREGLARVLVLEGSIARLRSEATGSALAFPKAVLADAEVVRRETEAWKARRRSLDESVAALRRSQALLDGEIEVSSRLAEKGLFSTVELSRLRRQSNELALQITERVNRFRADANAELVRYEGELAQLREGLESRRDSFERTTVRAPLRGVVKNLRATTLGSAISPGMPLLEIVPLDDQLLLEGRLPPTDVAYIHPGLPAKVKLSSFDTQIFGDLSGTVVRVSPDTFREDARVNPDAPGGYYRVIVRTEQTEFVTRDRRWPVLPGMTGSVEIRTGDKTVMDYLLKPMLKAREALRER